MASPGSATSGDVPGKYDVVINGFGYVLGDSVQSSLPFRTHRAIYDFSPPFVERQNVSNNYGDNTQDFFLTATQVDWSLGEQQRFFRIGNADSSRRYWKGTNVNPYFTDGRVYMRPAVASIGPGATITTCAPSITATQVVMFSSTNLYTVTGNSVSSIGAHGLGVSPGQFGVCSDGESLYFSSAAATNVRQWDGATTFVNFSSQAAGSLCFVDNTLWGADIQTIYSYDTSGTATSQFQWKGADGSTNAQTVVKILPYGGQVIALVVNAALACPGGLWVGDTNGFSQICEFDPGFFPTDMAIAQGIVFVAGYQGVFSRPAVSNIPTVNYYANGNIGRLWQSKLGSGSVRCSVCAYDQGILITDDSAGTVVYWNPQDGGVSTMFSYTASGVPTIAASSQQVVLTVNSTAVYGITATTGASSATVCSSLFDFDSTLPKVFRGVTVDWEMANPGDSGGTVDISYQVDSLDGSYTSLKTGATSGTEYTFPANTTGNSVSVQVTLNKGSSSYGPALKRLAVRAAPQLPQYKSATYLLDCTGSPNAPRQLRDGSFHPLSGYQQVINLQTAAQSTTPISITDKVNGTFTGFIDLNNSEGWDVYEVHPNVDDPNNAGSFFVRLTVRQV